MHRKLLLDGATRACRMTTTTLRHRAPDQLGVAAIAEIAPCSGPVCQSLSVAFHVRLAAGNGGRTDRVSFFMIGWNTQSEIRDPPS